MAQFPLLLPANEVWGKVIFSQVCVNHSVHRGGRGSLYDVTSCWAAWSHVPTRGSLSGRPLSRGSLSRRSLYRGSVGVGWEGGIRPVGSLYRLVSVQGVSVQGLSLSGNAFLLAYSTLLFRSTVLDDRNNTF